MEAEALVYLLINIVAYQETKAHCNTLGDAEAKTPIEKLADTLA